MLCEVLSDSAQISGPLNAAAPTESVRNALAQIEVTLIDSVLILETQNALVSHTSQALMVLQVHYAVHCAVIRFAVVRCAALQSGATRSVMEVHSVLALRYVAAELQRVKVVHYVVVVRKSALTMVVRFFFLVVPVQFVLDCALVSHPNLNCQAAPRVKVDRR